jgi:uncharacterized protein
MQQTDFLPAKKDFHVFRHKDECFILDTHTSSVFKTDAAFAHYLKSEPVNDDNKKPFEKRLNALQQLGLLKTNYKVASSPFTASVYKLSIEAYHGCNLNCVYCYGKASGIYHNTKQKPNPEALKNILDYFVFDFGKTAKSYEVNIVGAGEPFLNFSLIKELRAYSKVIQSKVGKPIIFWVFTNGTVFDDEIVDYFISEQQGITISFDGPAAIHDKLRSFPNGSGSHCIITEWIKKIQQKSKGKGGLENFWVSTVLTAEHPSLIEIVSHFKNLGIRNAQIRPIKTLNPGLAFTDETIEKLLSLYEELVYYLIDKVIAGDLEDLKIILNDRDFFGRYIIRIVSQNLSSYRCGAAKNKLCVLANGDIYPCDISSDIEDLKLGTVEQGISADKAGLFYTQEVSQKNICKDSWCRYLCGGGCYVAAFVNNHDISLPDRIKCKLTKKLIELAIIFIHEIQTKSPDDFLKVKRYIEVKQNVINHVYSKI